MRGSDTSKRIATMKYSNMLDNKINSPRITRDSECPNLADTHSVSHRQKERPSVSPQSITLPNGGLRGNNKIKQNPQGNNKSSKGNATSGIRNIMDQLKDNYPRFTNQNKFSRTKSEQNLILKGPLKGSSNEQPAKKPTQKSKVINQIQEKISLYNRGSQPISFQQDINESDDLLQVSRSPKRNDNATQRCRQMCMDLKKKILKETISTTMTQADEELSIKQFSLGRELGKGKFSRVYLARHNKTGIAVALKIIKKETIRKEKCDEQLIREIKIQSFFNHVNLIRLYGFFADQTNVYLIMEYSPGSQLYDIFKTKSKLKDQEWIPIMKGICEGIYALHLHGVIHRDLKPENIMMAMGLPKIGDFGWAVYSPNNRRQTFCGTPLYISPELLMGNTYNIKVDIWALGVMMYEFLTGRIPFKLNDNSSLLNMINSPIEYPNSLNPLGRDLIKMILNKDPQARIGIMDILEHEYLKIAPEVRSSR